MSKSVTLDLNADTRKARMEKLVSYLTSGQNWPSFLEEFEEDLSFDKTKEAWDSADEAVDINSSVTRMPANYAGALYRDAKYAHAGRNFLLKQGHHNAFRELYEGGKMGVDNLREWEEES